MREPAETSRTLRNGRRLTVRINGVLERNLQHKFSDSEEGRPPSPGRLVWRAIGGIVAHEELKELTFEDVGEYIQRTLPPRAFAGSVNERRVFSVRLTRRAGITKEGEQTHYLLVDGLIQLTDRGWLFTLHNLVPIPPPPELPQ